MSSCSLSNSTSYSIVAVRVSTHPPRQTMAEGLLRSASGCAQRTRFRNHPVDAEWRHSAHHPSVGSTTSCDPRHLWTLVSLGVLFSSGAAVAVNHDLCSETGQHCDHLPPGLLLPMLVRLVTPRRSGFLAQHRYHSETSAAAHKADQSKAVHHHGPSLRLWTKCNSTPEPPYICASSASRTPLFGSARPRLATRHLMFPEVRTKQEINCS